LLDESGRLIEAVDCQKRALAANPQYVDAMFNLALFPQRLGNHAEAATWWARYLERDRTSEWAERAKRALKYCEMELATAASIAAEPAEAAGRACFRTPGHTSLRNPASRLPRIRKLRPLL
jgi:tetratricopeptide (TPR) repeat protein